MKSSRITFASFATQLVFFFGLVHSAKSHWSVAAEQDMEQEEEEQAIQHFNEYTSLSNRIGTETDEEGTPPNTPIERKIVTQLLLFFLVFGMSASVDIGELRNQMQTKLTFIVGLAMQFIVMPFLGFVSVFTFKNYGLTTPMGLTLLMVTASPGGSYSNLLCSTFNASIELSIALTSISTILSIIMLPANLILYSQLAFLGEGSDGPLEGKNIISAIDFPALLTSIGVTIAGILAGIISSVIVSSSRAYSDSENKFAQISNRFGTICGIALIIVSIVFSTNNNSNNSDNNNDSGNNVTEALELDWSFYVAVAMPCIAGLSLTNAIAIMMGFEKPQCVSLSVECSYQNIAIATTAIYSMFGPSDQPQALAVPLFYGIVETVFVGMYCIIAWKLGWTHAPISDPLCKVLCEHYQQSGAIVDEEQQNGDEEEQQNGDEPQYNEQIYSLRGVSTPPLSEQYLRLRPTQQGQQNFHARGVSAPAIVQHLESEQHRQPSLKSMS